MWSLFSTKDKLQTTGRVPVLFNAMTWRNGICLLSNSVESNNDYKTTIPVKRRASSSNTACKVLTSPRFSKRMLSKSWLHMENKHKKLMILQHTNHFLMIAQYLNLHGNNWFNKPWFWNIYVHCKCFWQWHVCKESFRSVYRMICTAKIILHIKWLSITAGN